MRRLLHSWALACAMGLLVAGCGGGGAVSAPEPAPEPISQAPRPGEPQPVQTRLTELRRDLVQPWGMAFLPDGRLLVTGRNGSLRLLWPAGDQALSIEGLPEVDARGQGGLLDVALDPDFERNRRIYLSFSEPDPGQPDRSGTAVARATWPAGADRLQDLVVIWRQQPKLASTTHFGSRLVFDRQGALFVTLGDRGQPALAQDLTQGHGKIVRITAEGAPAPGNPAWQAAGAQPTTWSLGHRNVQGAAVHPGTGELWVSEHGPDGGDEINRVLAGRNYGWPRVSRGFAYGTTDPVGTGGSPGMEDPAWVWETQDGSPWNGGAKSSIAPAGMAFYDHPAVPAWRGSLFVTALAGRALFRLELDGEQVVGQERLLASAGERLRDVAQGPDGALYLLTDSGRLLRYGPAR